MKKNDFILKFKEPFNFEGKEYSEVDLSGITSLCAELMRSTGHVIRYGNRVIRCRDELYVQLPISGEGNMLTN